ncbi:hypothetical protein [Acerihabitans sp.]|uniref:hypothetical protein n=1 Tax=Acerihabitans sp. TaxID=2811394 RepID=UPI002EDB59FA
MNNYDDIKRFKEKLNMEDIDYKEIAESNPNISSHHWAIINQVATADEPFHPLEQGRSTQPIPTPVSQKEFNASPLGAPTAAQQPGAGGDIHQDIGAVNAHYQPQVFPASPVYASPLMSAVGKALPATSHASPAAATPAGNAHAGAAFLNAIQQELAAARAPLFDDGRQGHPDQAPLFGDGRQGQPARAPLFGDGHQGQAAPAPSPEALSARVSASAMPFNRLFNRKSPASATLPGRDTPLSLLLENIALCR